jgi:rhamnose utilization protein RhaD (predicted bifunctional aldolase and dehydrogenase)/NAD(P)-dependent dehydrogenase (short-subunit alcohol dehydrogenase family)
MTNTEPATALLKFLEDRWNASVASALDEQELLRYRSNLLGADLRITNFAGGNTSSKIMQADPLTGEPVEVLWVKGSGGDLGSIKRSGFAALYQEKLLAIERSYKGVDFEDDVVTLYPMCAFGGNTVPASIDTPLHGFLPFKHVDHLHPDWGIAVAAAANGKTKMEEFNHTFGHSIVWIPWQRPGFELGLMMRRAVAENPGCDGILLGGHGLFTWGETQRDCYLNTVTMIDHFGQFIEKHAQTKGSARFGGEVVAARPDRRNLAVQIAPFLRGRVSMQRRHIAHFSDAPDVLQFVNSLNARELAFMGTSCPDHFIRTKIRPLFVPWAGDAGIDDLRKQIEISLSEYRKQYRAYYRTFATPASPAVRDPNPAVVLIPGMGMFSFGKNKTEARITGEFYTNAIHVMEGATLLSEGDLSPGTVVPQCAPGMDPASFRVLTNYVALPAREAFRIEYWALEDAKLKRQPPEKELSRRVAVVFGGASGIGRETARLAAARGAHVLVADINEEGCARIAEELKSLTAAESTAVIPADVRSRESIAKALNAAVAAFGGIDILVNTVAVYPTSPDGELPDTVWPRTLETNLTANYYVAEEAQKIFKEQGLHGNIVFTSSSNSVIPKVGSEAYGASKAALSHLIRDLAVGYAPNTRVNGIAPATVVRGSAMFPREQLRRSLQKCDVPFQEIFTDEELRSRLAIHLAERTLTLKEIVPADCAEAILFLASTRARCTTGHLIPIDGGIPEAFLR